MSSINTILTRDALMRFEYDYIDKGFDLGLSLSQLSNKITIFDWRHQFHRATSLNLRLLEKLFPARGYRGFKHIWVVRTAL